MMAAYSSRIRVVLRAILSGIAFLPAAAMAQSATAPTESSAGARDDDANNDVVVQARRREETLQTVPIAITALTPAAIEQKQIVTTQDLTFVTPGLNVAPALSRDIPAFVIRGQQRLASGSGAPAVVTYFADVPLPNEGSLLPTFDVASLQILKGPQGTLFGRNTTGGAVLLYPAAATGELGGYAKASYGSYDEHILEGAINLPIASDAVAVRFAGQIARRDGYTRNLGAGGGFLDDRHTDAGRVTLLLKPTDTLRNVTIVDYYHANERGTATVLYGTYPNAANADGGLGRLVPFRPFFDCGTSPTCDIDLALAVQQQNGPRTTRTGIVPYSRRTLWGITNTTTLDVGDVTFKNIFGYRSTVIRFARDYDGTPFQINDQIGRTPPVQYSNETQILGKSFDGKLDWIAGFFYLNADTRGRAGARVGNFAPPNPPTVSENYGKTNSKAVFAQVGYDLDTLLSGLRINAGGRYTWDRINVCASTRSATLGFLGSRAKCITGGGNFGEVKSSAPTWSFGLDYQANRDVFLYAVTRRGYRAAGVNRSGLNPILADYENYAPEKVTDVELGAKTRWSTGGLRGTFDIAGYRSKFSNIQITLVPGSNFDRDNNPANDAFSIVVNAAKATIQGFEANATISPVRGLTFGGFVSYVDAHFDAFSVAPVLARLISANATASKFTNVPAWSGGGSIHYGTDLPDGLGDVGFDLNYFRSGQTQFNSRAGDPNAIQAPYDTTNARIAWNNIAGSGVSAAVFARNLFNTLYSPAGGFVVSTFTTASRVYNEPRIIGGELRVKF